MPTINDDVMANELVENRYWWQSFLYFMACAILWFILSVSYATRSVFNIFVIFVNFGVCAIVTVSKMLNCFDTNVILGFETLYVHGTLPSAMAVVSLRPLIPTSKMSMLTVSLWLAAATGLLGHPLYVSFVGLIVSTPQFIVVDFLTLNMQTTNQYIGRGICMIAGRMVVAILSKLAVCSNEEIIIASGRSATTRGIFGCTCAFEQAVFRNTRFINQRILIATMTGPYVAYTFLECAIYLTMTGDSDKSTGLSPMRALTLVIASLALGSIEAHIVVARLKSINALLMDIIPRQVAEVLLKKGAATIGTNHGIYSDNFATSKLFDVDADHKIVYAKVHASVTVLFADIVGFTSMARECEPSTVMTMLNDLFCGFDDATLESQVYKVETIGDCYMAATGLFEEETLHADKMVRFACRMLRHAERVPSASNKKEHVSIRIGIHSGSVSSGIVGLIRRRYCLFGSTVNTASRYESTGIPGRIHISEETFNMLVNNSPHEPEVIRRAWEFRGRIYMKGLGDMKSYLLMST